MRGKVEHMAGSHPQTGRPTFGFIRGEDGESHFFIPTGLQQTTLRFDEIEVGMPVEFTVIEHPKGSRAIEVRILAEVNDGNH